MHCNDASETINLFIELGDLKKMKKTVSLNDAFGATGMDDHGCCRTEQIESNGNGKLKKLTKTSVFVCK